MREVKHVHEGAKNMKPEFWNQTPMSVPHKPHYFLTLKKNKQPNSFYKNWESMLYYKKKKDKVMAGYFIFKE